VVQWSTTLTADFYYYSSSSFRKTLSKEQGLILGELFIIGFMFKDLCVPQRQVSTCECLFSEFIYYITEKFKDRTVTELENFAPKTKTRNDFVVVKADKGD
jgi:hypothetical protein